MKGRLVRTDVGYFLETDTPLAQEATEQFKATMGHALTTLPPERAVLVLPEGVTYHDARSSGYEPARFRPLIETSGGLGVDWFLGVALFVVGILVGLLADSGAFPW